MARHVIDGLGEQREQQVVIRTEALEEWSVGREWSQGLGWGAEHLETTVENVLEESWQEETIAREVAGLEEAQPLRKALRKEQKMSLR